MYRKMQMEKIGKEIFANMFEFLFHFKKTTWKLKTMHYGYSL